MEGFSVRQVRGSHALLIFLVFGLNLMARDPFQAPSHASRILGEVDFENRKPGERYGLFDVKGDFGTLLSLGTHWFMQRCEIVAFDSVFGNVLRVNYPEKKLRSLRSGASWKWQPFYPRQDVTLSYAVFFPDSFVFRAGGKLHGLIGGKGNTGGAKPTGKDGWSCRVHWGDQDKIKLYIYHKDQTRKWGDTFYFRLNPSTIRLGAEGDDARNQSPEVRIERGVWHRISIRVKVNAAGFKDGLVQAWWNDELVADVRGFEFRDETCGPEELLINGMYFSTFFGGRGESYAPVKDEYILFDHFKLSTPSP